MTIPSRKQIRLQNFDYSKGNAYFITICTYKSARLFGDIVSDEVGAHLCVRPNHPEKIIEKWLREIEIKYANALLSAYIIMPDHIHFILQNPGVYDETGAHIGAPLPEIIKWFKTQTTNEYIRGVREGLFPPFDKHIWQRSYFEHIIRDQNDFVTRRKYIYENPMRWMHKNKK